jgi:hypothetical protein
MGSLPVGPARENGQPVPGVESEDSAYAAVSVSCGESACCRAEAIAGIRFLIDEAPRLPMPDCTAETCTCRYFHFRDRRSFLSNRRSGTGLERVPPKALFEQDRRRGPNRRKLKILELDHPA